MLQTLARKPKSIAWFFVTLFYLQLVLIPVVTRANGRPISKNSYFNNTGHQLFDKKENSKMQEETATKKQAVALNGPAHENGIATTGPTQPEMQSFSSVNANNLVDPFTGDFSYNIPLLDVGGYPVNLHYQSGITMDQEASWVGLGWNINPGVVSRNMRGLPDDFKGENDTVQKTIAIQPNRTLGITIGGNVELFGVSKLTKVPLTDSTSKDVKGRTGVLGASLGIFHNTYKGWGTEFGVNANINAGKVATSPLTAGLSITNNSQDGLDISPSISYKLGKENAKRNGDISIGTNYNSRTGIQNLQLTGQRRRYDNDRKKMGIGASAGLSFAKPSYTPTINVPYTTNAYSFTAKVGSEFWGLHPNFYIRGYGSKQEVEPGDRTLTLPAYGYLYYDKAGKDRNVLLDFNREKDVPYTDNSPHIAVPIYTYDTWSISGEGTGGMFRAYRGDIGYVFDHSLSTKSNSDKFSLDLGFNSVFHAGVDYNKVYATSQNNPWVGNNNFIAVIPFKQQDTTFENVYFKNPGEKTAVNKRYLQSIGNDSLMRVSLYAANRNAPVTMTTRLATLFKSAKPVASRLFDENTVRRERDKRTQVISYLNASEATGGGLDKKIRSYSINSFPNGTCYNNYVDLERVTAEKKGHHLSEISVLNPDGRRYVYGVPVYNKIQTEVTMATDPGNNNTGLVKYDSTPWNAGVKGNSVDNGKGKDGYYNREKMSAYSHSFLLSGILSSDYVDITGNGISDDDYGDAVKFNYSQIHSIGDPYKWRAPMGKDTAFYNEGLKTDSRDERGSFTYGEREVWYLNSVESKTMIATFVLDTDSIRQDAYGVKDENGGIESGRKLYRLKQINLYTKADYLKNGGQAKPIKSVHFAYSYALCKGNPGSLAGKGKLTLTKVWFEYNGNSKGKRNPYVFTYNAANPDYNNKSVDRWGSYKNSSDNPGSAGRELSNADYPYTLQTGVKTWDSAKAAANAAPWTLSQIKLPSGGRMEVTYESDDYAYVQNRRAMQLFSIAGFGSNQNTVAPRLYPPYGFGDDHHYVFINVPEAVNSPAEVYRKYLEGVTQLYFKLAVNVPGDSWGRGYEFIPVYADIVSYGVRNGNNNMIWIEVKSIEKKESPFTTAALQFLRLNLPSKAYPFSEPGDNLDFRTFGGTFATLAGNVANAIGGFRGTSRGKNWCNNIETDRSFVRLNNPVYKKLGGGLRVKKVELFDNWNKMTGQQESTYGQTYDYSTDTIINGVKTRMSSGVATYEPMVGNEENPFRVPQKVYPVKVGALVPADYMYTEEPFAETFFPSPMVGYSKIRVQTIHKGKKSANGFDETEFYTAKDFPVIVEYTPIDNDSKKTYNPRVNNFLRFDAKHYVTLSQGFRIELNDMHGKLKSQSSYAENDPDKPISFTYNYYKLKNDNAGQPALSNTVAMVDSTNGSIDTAAQMGMEVELMVDIREESSFNISGSVEVNMDFVNPWPPIIVGTSLPLPSFETNRYRSIAVLKIVNRYGILDSVLHIEKGSRVTTRNLLYDGETGDVLLSQTNNEFDDPVYNFSYPAHWAYKGMGPAYSNIGTVLKDVTFRKGIMMYQNGQRVPVERFFESGDEVLVYGYDKRNSGINDHCDNNYYLFDKSQQPQYRKIWAVDAARGKEGQKGIYFIDRDGIPYTADTKYIRIIRSGKRNLSGVPVGSVTSLATPLRKVNGDWRIVFDSATHVIAANAARFKDLWKVDSTLYQKDTLVWEPRKLIEKPYEAKAEDLFAIHDYQGPNDNTTDLGVPPNYYYFEATAYDAGTSNYHEHLKSYLRFNLSNIPRGAVITFAKLHLYGSVQTPHRNYRYSNESYIERVKAKWLRDTIPASNPPGTLLSAYFYDNDHTTIDQNNRVYLPATPHNADDNRNEDLDIKAMTQDMLDQYYNSNGNVSPAIRISLLNAAEGENQMSRLAYNAGRTQNECPNVETNCTPFIEIKYVDPCTNGTIPYYSGSNPDPEGRMAAFADLPGYYCMDGLKDSTVCRPNINDTALNYYRFGVLGNWRMDRAYTYYSNRKQTDPSDSTNIRTDGEIKDFQPYWTFTNGLLSASTDTSRWVWNSEMTRFNNKGYEIENHDPLNRYNAGIYGYNQTLPIAVAQNAQNREIAFDGFEDYGYQTGDCKNCLVNRHVDLGSDATLVDTVSHTGLYSLRVPGNNTVTRNFKVGNASQGPELSMKEDSIPLVTTTVNGNGTGLSAQTDVKKISIFCQTVPFYSINAPGTIDFNTTDRKISDVCRTENFKVQWNGFVQPRYTGTYTFLGIGDDFMTVKIKLNGVFVNITEDTDLEKVHNWPDLIPMKPVQLEAGELYEIFVEWTGGDGFNEVELQWESSGLQTQTRQIVPGQCLYPAGSDVAAIKAATVHRDTAWCVQFKNPTAKRVLHEKFSPLQKQKVVVSAWVKQEAECVGSNYDKAELVLTFNNSTGPNVFTLKPSGNIIEGWQRIEDTLTIPAGATGLDVHMKSTSAAPVFFDDVRVVPFNGNMKSFVYNPVNLRLMAELDENNYATFYEYDDEGTLIRLKKETERGIKTIKETRSAMGRE